MSKKITYDYCNKLVKEFEKVVKNPIKERSSFYYTGVDLGTSCVVIAVLDENKRPVAGAYRYASVVKDGMIVDYVGAVKIVRELKEEIEKKLGVTLTYAAAAIPPGTDKLDGGVVKNVVEAAGFELTDLSDESTAANEVLQIKNGVIVDVGGGTTGISVFKDGKVVYIADEPTGGTHFSLVIAGAYRMPFEEAELFKRNKKNYNEVFGLLVPVIEKVASIIETHIKDYKIEEICLVGGTTCLDEIEKIIENKTGIKTTKPKNPMFVTPLGIALSCKHK
ncbi:ethanolamine utilization protein EutJ [Pseudoleptotrichia goodfellowii]|uniref:Ethanolamine utilization protein EutJ family protein n=1 Tax=Pseudoleptotrichia goodfellowii F0264 TaxID=596323 RepID=D0GPK1_9FUSO|nr:ethanolamine utilization protein EutJ [Pseudoleptotrichia goodfellowii]EEY33957.1 ethanolamine utilization protein EutJ family protein [Pseudoleptotrichia goodfellowii F0264]